MVFAVRSKNIFRASIRDERRTAACKDSTAISVHLQDSAQFLPKRNGPPPPDQTHRRLYLHRKKKLTKARVDGSFISLFQRFVRIFPLRDQRIQTGLHPRRILLIRNPKPLRRCRDHPDLPLPSLISLSPMIGIKNSALGLVPCSFKKSPNIFSVYANTEGSKPQKFIDTFESKGTSNFLSPSS
jgi:hypothetical protein